MILPYPGGYAALQSAVFEVVDQKNLPPDHIQKLSTLNMQAGKCISRYTSSDPGSYERLKALFYKHFIFDKASVYFKARDTDAPLLLPPEQARLYLTIDRFYRQIPKLSADPISSPVIPHFSGQLFPKNHYELLETGKPQFILPSEILLKIFKYAITNREDLFSISLTCKHFYSLVNPALKSHLIENPSIFRSPFVDIRLINESVKRGVFQREFRQSEVNCTDRHLQFISAYAPEDSTLEVLSITGKEFSPQGLADALKRLPNIRSIEFTGNEAENFDDYILVVSEFANQITEIKIIDCPFMTDQSLFALMRCQELIAFEYRDNQGDGQLTDYGFLPFLISTKSRSIQLTGCPEITQIPLRTFIKQNPQLLENLEFSYCGLVNELLLQDIATCSNLRRLGLSFSPNQAASDPDRRKIQSLAMIFTQCPLEEVKIHDCHYLPPQTIGELVSYKKTYLRRLDIQRSTYPEGMLSKFDVYQAFSECEGLEYLRYLPLQTSDYATVQNILDVISSCQHLSTFEVVYRPSQSAADSSEASSILNPSTRLGSITLHFNGEDIEGMLWTRLAQMVPNLRNLSIELGTALNKEMNRFTNESVLQILSMWRGLNSFHLKYSDIATGLLSLDSSLFQEIASIQPKITELTLDSVQGVKSDDFNVEFKPLIHLGLPRSQFDESDAIRLLEKNGGMLRSLDLEGCEWINLKILLDIAKLCPRLRYLNLELTPVSEKDVEAFRSHLHHVTYIRG